MSDRAWEISGMIFSADSDLIDHVMEALGDALFDITQDATIGGHLVTLDENGETAADRRWDALTSEINERRDQIDPQVAEALYDETIAWNVDVRGGTAVASEWPSWDELPDLVREHWVGMAVAARLSLLTVLRAVSEDSNA